MKAGFASSPSSHGSRTLESDAALRRRVRALSSLIELLGNAKARRPPARLHRQILISTMGALDARSGVAFCISPDGRASLIGPADPCESGPADPPIVLSEQARRLLCSGGPLEVLGEEQAASWFEFSRGCDPDLRPRILIRLKHGAQAVGFMLLGGLPETGNDGVDLSLCGAVTGLFEIASRAGAATSSTTIPRTSPPTTVAGGTAGVRVNELRQYDHVLRRFVGNSEVVDSILSDVIGVVGSNCPILFEGESGTGKELLARLAHEIAFGKDAPFEAINCGAIPEALVESELFGHVAGAFTGAANEHRGLFERAKGGTVFLDEITEMPLAAQVKLLRVLQEGTFSPVGGEKLHHCSARVMAATNHNLLREVQGGRFRKDLYYRLNVFPIRIPPLRERREDIPTLVRDSLDRNAAESGHPRPVVSEDAMRRLSVYSYPGNVRELQNVVRALVVEARGGNEIADAHVIAVFSRHRVIDWDAPPAPAPATMESQEVGRWVLVELRRYYFNLALAERMLEERKRVERGRRAVPVVSRSGLTYYLEGECFQALAAESWDRARAAARLAGDEKLIPRVRLKLDRILDGALEVLARTDSSESAQIAALRSRFAKVPGCYALSLARLVREFRTGRWAQVGRS